MERRKAITEHSVERYLRRESGTVTRQYSLDAFLPQTVYRRIDGILIRDDQVQPTNYRGDLRCPVRDCFVNHRTLTGASPSGVADDVHDTRMAASGEYHDTVTFDLGVDTEVVEHAIRLENPILQREQTCVGPFEGCFAGNLAAGGQSFGETQGCAGQDETGSGRLDAGSAVGRWYPDRAQAWDCLEIGTEDVRVRNHRKSLPSYSLDDSHQTPGMIVMTVSENDHIDRSGVDSQELHIAEKRFRVLRYVHEDPCVFEGAVLHGFGLDKQGDAVLTKAGRFVSDAVLRENRYFQAADHRFVIPRKLPRENNSGIDVIRGLMRSED